MYGGAKSNPKITRFATQNTKNNDILFSYMKDNFVIPDISQGLPGAIIVTNYILSQLKKKKKKKNNFLC